MTSAAQHKLHVYPDAATSRKILAAGNILSPSETHVFADLEGAIVSAVALMEITGDAFRADVEADPDHCSLEDYIRAANTQALYLEHHPQEGCAKGMLAEADYFRAEFGITTARALDDHFFLESFSDTYKQMTGTPPGLPAENPRRSRSHARRPDLRRRSCLIGQPLQTISKIGRDLYGPGNHHLAR